MDAMQTATETQTAAPTMRLLGRCKTCGKVHRIEGVIVPTGRKDARIVAGMEVSFWKGGWQCSPICCGQHILCRKVVWTAGNEHKCSAKCQSATGHQCECECRGKNHGGK